jgi:hypothetical protein
MPRPKLKESKDVHEALFRFQGETIKIPRNGNGVINGKEYAYAMLDDIISITRPFLQKHGLAITQPTEGVEIQTILSHPASSTSISSKLPLGNPSSSQDMGSRITYFRRYMLASILGLSLETDIDGAKVALPASPSYVDKMPPTELTPDTKPLKDDVEVPKSSFFVTASDAIRACKIPQGLEAIKDRVTISIKLSEPEKAELLEMIKIKDSEINGTINRD